MPRPFKFIVWFDEDGEAVKAQPVGGPEVPNPNEPGEEAPKGTVKGIKNLTLVRTEANNPTCCWWVMVGGRYYCMPIPCP